MLHGERIRKNFKDRLDVYVANESGSSVIKFKASDQTAQGSITIPAPRGMCFDGATLWVASNSQGALVAVNPASVSVIGSIPVGNAPVDCCYDGNGYIWVANQGANSVSKVSIASMSVVGTYPVGTSPVAICTDGQFIWTADSASNTATQLDMDGNKIGQYAIGASPAGICFDGINIWVTTKAGKALYRR